LSQLYNKIKELCDQNNVTISKMCKESHIPNSVIYELKSGKREGISTKTALKISEYFGVPINHLYPPIVIDTKKVADAVMQGTKKEPPIMDGKTFELVMLLNRLSDENLVKALDYIQYLLSTQQ